MEDYIIGFEDCLEYFEDSINMIIERLTSDEHYGIEQALDSIIATLYISKLDLGTVKSQCDSVILERMLNIIKDEEANLDSIFASVYNIFRGEDVSE